MKHSHVLAAAFAAGLVFCAAGAVRAQDCSTQTAPIAAAETSLQQADQALAKHDNASATTAYSAAMADLKPTSLQISDSKCDPPRYSYDRFIAVLHSLNVAIALNQMPPLQAQSIMEQMWHVLTTAPDKSDEGRLAAADYYKTHYADLYAKAQQYEDQINKLANAQKVSVHTPGAGKCQYPDVDSEPLSDVVDPAAVTKALGVLQQPGNYLAQVNVQLDAQGKVTAATIAQSSGVKAFDQAALDAARSTAYLPKVSGCKTVASTYLYSFNIVSDSRH